MFQILAALVVFIQTPGEGIGAAADYSATFFIIHMNSPFSKFGVIKFISLYLV